MVTGRRMTFDISRPATLNRRNDFRAISRLRRGYSRSVIDGMHNNEPKPRKSAPQCLASSLRPDDIAQASLTGDMRL
jgi:hypothetical protein